MVNSPVVSTADSASDWSSPGVAQPPRIPSRSLFTIPPGVVEHPHTELGRPFSSSGAFRSAPGPPVKRRSRPRVLLPRPPQPNHHNHPHGRPVHPSAPARYVTGCPEVAYERPCTEGKMDKERQSEK